MLRRVPMRPNAPCILYVEASSRIRDELAAVLRKRKFDVEVVASVAAAGTAFDQSAFDLVVLDGALRRNDALRWLASHRRAADTIPVVLLCGFADDEEVLAGYRAGATFCLQRPIRGEVLAANLKALLALAKPRALRAGQLSIDLSRNVVVFPGGSTAQP
jgi:DNA-binding response OmpR family regulator